MRSQNSVSETCRAMEAGFAIYPPSSSTIIRGSVGSVKLIMGIFQIKITLLNCYTPIITECLENVKGPVTGPLGNVRYFHLMKVSNIIECVVEHHIDSIRIDWIELVWLGRWLVGGCFPVLGLLFLSFFLEYYAKDI
jgi:hypothetical protein